jgi:hypothetical protein
MPLNVIAHIRRGGRRPGGGDGGADRARRGEDPAAMPPEGAAASAADVGPLGAVRPRVRGRYEPTVAGAGSSRTGEPVTASWCRATSPRNRYVWRSISRTSRSVTSACTPLHAFS